MLPFPLWDCRFKSQSSQHKSPDHVGTGLIANGERKRHCCNDPAPSAHCASYLSAGTSTPHLPPLHTPPSPTPKTLQWAGSQWWLSFLFRYCTTQQGALQFSLLAYQPVSQSITWGFHPAADYRAYPASTSPQLRCWQLEMTITYGVIVESAISPSARTDSLCLCRVKGRNVSDIFLCLIFAFPPFRTFIYYDPRLCSFPLCFFSCRFFCFCVLGQRQLRHPECQPADGIASGSGASTHPNSAG